MALIFRFFFYCGLTSICPSPQAVFYIAFKIRTGNINDWIFIANPSNSGASTFLLSIVHSVKTGILFYSTLVPDSPASIACGPYMNSKAAGAKEALRLC
ncbi:MAG: hypothetical protein ACLVAA_08530 [Ruthenibacterium sp.]